MSGCHTRELGHGAVRPEVPQPSDAAGGNKKLVSPFLPRPLLL